MTATSRRGLLPPRHVKAPSCIFPKCCSCYVTKENAISPHVIHELTDDHNWLASLWLWLGESLPSIFFAGDNRANGFLLSSDGRTLNNMFNPQHCLSFYYVQTSLLFTAISNMCEKSDIILTQLILSVCWYHVLGSVCLDNDKPDHS